MAPEPIIFALANPVPEIMPDLAQAQVHQLSQPGRSGLPKPDKQCSSISGIFRGALDTRSREINESMKLAATDALASAVPEEKLSGTTFCRGRSSRESQKKVALAVGRASIDSGCSRLSGEVNLEQLIERGFKKSESLVSEITYLRDGKDRLHRAHYCMNAVLHAKAFTDGDPKSSKASVFGFQ